MVNRPSRYISNIDLNLSTGRLINFQNENQRADIEEEGKEEEEEEEEEEEKKTMMMNHFSSECKLPSVFGYQPHIANSVFN